MLSQESALRFGVVMDAAPPAPSIDTSDLREALRALDGVSQVTVFVQDEAMFVSGTGGDLCEVSGVLDAHKILGHGISLNWQF